MDAVVCCSRAEQFVPRGQGHTRTQRLREVQAAVEDCVVASQAMRLGVMHVIPVAAGNIRAQQRDDWSCE